MKTVPRWAKSRPIARRGAGSSLQFRMGNAMALPTLAGPPINSHTALTIAGVWNAVNLIANAVACLDSGVAERMPDGGRKPATELRLYDLLSRKPNDKNTAFRYRRSKMVHALTEGNGYSEIEFAGNKPIGLHLLEPRNVDPRINDDGKLVYRLIREKIDLPPEKVIHLSNLGWDGIKGYSPITIGREMLGLAKGQEQYQSGLIGNSAVPPGFIEVPQVLREDAKNRFRSDYEAMHRGADNAGTVGLLDGGAKWVQTSFSPADQELILGRGFSIAEIARLFCIPQHMIGLLEHATFSNIEQQLMEFYTFTLLPWLTNLEQEMDVKFFDRIGRGTYFVFHDLKTLMRADTAASTAKDVADFEHGFASLNQIALRRGENPNTHPNADKHYIPINNLMAIEDMPAKLDPADKPEPPDLVIDPAEEPAPEEPESFPAEATDSERSLAVDLAIESLSGEDM